MSQTAKQQPARRNRKKTHNQTADNLSQVITNLKILTFELFTARIFDSFQRVERNKKKYTHLKRTTFE